MLRAESSIGFFFGKRLKFRASSILFGDKRTVHFWENRSKRVHPLTGTLEDFFNSNLEGDPEGRLKNWTKRKQ
jgi:hypothetical protein